jgi:hypothetical protein
MRAFMTTVAFLSLTAAAQASAGVSCSADDGSVAFSLDGAYGRSEGSAPANFGGEIEIKLKGVPDHARKIKVEREHLTMNWFHERVLKLAVQWTREGSEPSAEVLMVIETQRGKSEESPYRGRYTLSVHVPDQIPGGDGKPKKASGRVICSAE